MLVQPQKQSNIDFKGFGRPYNESKYVNGVFKKIIRIEPGVMKFDERLLEGADLLVMNGGVLERKVNVKYLYATDKFRHVGITCEHAHLSGDHYYQPSTGVKNHGLITTKRNLVAENANIGYDLSIGGKAFFRDSKNLGKVKVYGDFWNLGSSSVSDVHGFANARNKDKARMEDCTFDGTFCNQDKAKAWRTKVGSVLENHGTAEIYGGSCQDLWNTGNAETYNVHATGNTWNRENAEVHGGVTDGDFWNNDNAKGFNLNVKSKFENNDSAYVNNVKANQIYINDESTIEGHINGVISAFSTRANYEKAKFSGLAAYTVKSFLKHIKQIKKQMEQGQVAQ